MWLNLPLITRVTLNHVCVFVFAFSAVSLVKISEIRGLKKQLMLPRITRITLNCVCYCLPFLVSDSCKLVKLVANKMWLMLPQITRIILNCVYECLPFVRST